MKKSLISFLTITCTAIFAAQYTYTTRIDDTSETGVTYVGRAASDFSDTSTNTVESLETKSVWMITKYTSSNVLHSGGSAMLYNTVWTNRANITYK